MDASSAFERRVTASPHVQPSAHTYTDTAVRGPSVCQARGPVDMTHVHVIVDVIVTTAAAA